jgi:hypothetical protein
MSSALHQIQNFQPRTLAPGASAGVTQIDTGFFFSINENP